MIRIVGNYGNGARVANKRESKRRSLRKGKGQMRKEESPIGGSTRGAHDYYTLNGFRREVRTLQRVSKGSRGFIRLKRTLKERGVCCRELRGSMGFKLGYRDFRGLRASGILGDFMEVKDDFSGVAERF